MIVCDTNVCIYKILCGLRIGAFFDFNAHIDAKKYKCAFDFIHQTTQAGNLLAVTATIKNQGYPVLERILKEEVFDKYGFPQYSAARQAGLVQCSKKLSKFFDSYSLHQLDMPEPIISDSEREEVKTFYLAFIQQLNAIALRKRRSDPLPEKSDLTILAEVSKIERNLRAGNYKPNVTIGKVGLYSNDHDFTEFVPEIRNRFNILVHPLVVK